MAIKIYCYVCEAELIRPGALLFSPPDASSACYKKHFCDVCYETVLYDHIEEIRTNKDA